MEFRVFFKESAHFGLHGIQVDVLDPEHFWSEPARVSKSMGFARDACIWEPAEFNYGSGGAQKGVAPVALARAKAAALLRAAEIMEELDRLWPPGSAVKPQPNERVA